MTFTSHIVKVKLTVKLGDTIVDNLFTSHIVKVKQIEQRAKAARIESLHPT